MKKQEKRFLIKLYLGVFLMTLFCIWNINKIETINKNVDNNVIVMNKK